MLFIDNALVSELLSMKECIDAQEAAFQDIPSGRAAHRPRLDMYAPCERDDGYYRWGTMEGVHDGIFSIRMKSDVITWPTDGAGRWTEDKYCVEPGTYCGLVFLLSSENGEPLAMINDGTIQHMRVGGGAGIGVKHLSRADAKTVGLLGSGGMARTYLQAFSVVRDIERVKVFSPTLANRERFANEMSAELGIDVDAVDSAQAAVAGSDVLASATDSMEPTFDADWLEPGMHVTNLGPAEISHEVLDRVDVKVRQGTSGVEMPETDHIKGGIGHSPMAYIAGTEDDRKRLPIRDDKTSGFKVNFPDYCDIMTDRSKGRTSDDQITYYHNMGFQGLQFASVGGLVYRKARAAGKGHEIPTELFLQDIRD